jgi:hypothetical protein
MRLLLVLRVIAMTQRRVTASPIGRGSLPSDVEIASSATRHRNDTSEIIEITDELETERPFSMPVPGGALIVYNLAAGFPTDKTLSLPVMLYYQ